MKKLSEERIKEIQHYLNQLSNLRQKDMVPFIGITRQGLTNIITRNNLKIPERKFMPYKVDKKK